mmetsp:Transcript_2858/g.4849  ORF Transcript_2858/g.4849 Transcript_2858/m.4849 type:complete len:183 (-) Transcript_2858:155-703(-)|eukprot:CAMPEP_0184531986 /NCGR_PEP_ID=MMETSP0198_2-20121128/13890_1 /TAXON_ID=1112570 /ORGANISM="Thraustochytrium sp., Strain LLF1b" /LENGTH=182 /DNA_ID=CAMNT_0026924481 /DNA_START=122 /DNA_END=670 /DNA_ORIENTATION=-
MVEIEEISQEDGAGNDDGLRQRKGDGYRTEDLSEGKGRLIKKVLREGEGEVCGEKKRVVVHYTGRLEDGTVFDSSVERRKPFRFYVGTHCVILGWDVGIASMKKGEKALLICKPEYAYGEEGAGGVIPPGATLHFEVELVDIGEELDTSGGFSALLIVILSALSIFLVAGFPYLFKDEETTE